MHGLDFVLPLSYSLGGIPMVRKVMALARLNPLKRLRTHRTLVRPNVGMDTVVSLHVVHSRERQAAVRAREGLPAEMRGLVRLEIAGPGEEAATVFAAV